VLSSSDIAGIITSQNAGTRPEPDEWPRAQKPKELVDGRSGGSSCEGSPDRAPTIQADEERNLRQNELQLGGEILVPAETLCGNRKGKFMFHIVTLPAASIVSEREGST